MQIVDLTHPFADGMPVFPGLPEPSFRPIASVPEDGYAMTELHLLNHIGTHVDAPAHQIAGGDTLDDIPLERLVTHALTIDVSERPPGPIPLSELESQLHHLHPGDILFLCSDNARHWGTEAYWTGWSYPDIECAGALVECGISAIGFDGPSADPVDSTTFDLHRLWLSSGQMIIENVANLTELPARCQVVVAPIKLTGSNGAPARIFALLPDERGDR
ncbi:MAG TPA: cyclase family protein [Solirubrobacteraceae bacterium]|nr:cyclase family protein [Solirubrobacteraceae bacterium]